MVPDLQLRTGIPRFSVAPAVEQIDRLRPILLLGELPTETRLAIERAGVEVVRARSVSDALANLSAIVFRAMAVSPMAEGAFALVRQAKLVPPDDGIAREAADRNRLMPIVLLPHPGDDEYVVIVEPPHAAWLDRGRETPLSDVLLRLDVEKLLSSIDG